MTRRAPEAVLAALEMDPERRDVYVEGPTDQHILMWLARDCISDDAVVQDSDALEIPDCDGARDRLVALANLVGRHGRMIVFVDADTEPTRPASPDSVLVLTDRRDLEGYLLTEECLDKVLTVGLATSTLSGAALLASVLMESRKLGVLRRLSDDNSWEMPFRRTALHPSIKASRTSVAVDIRNVVSRLSAQSIGEGRVEEVLELHVAATARLEGVPDHELVHGKDATAIIGEVLLKYGVSRDDSGRLLRMSIERGKAGEYPNLQYVIAFLCA